MLTSAYSNWQSITDRDTLAQIAIEAASTANWTGAVKINQKILKVAQDDIEALNRLAHAYTCLGKRESAQKIYKKVLEIDHYNIIANKNLEKLAKLNGQTNDNGQSKNSDLASIFLFEPGKTKMINLLNLAPPSTLATLNCGDQVILNLKRHSVGITTQ